MLFGLVIDHIENTRDSNLHFLSLFSHGRAAISALRSSNGLILYIFAIPVDRSKENNISGRSRALL